MQEQASREHEEPRIHQGVVDCVAVLEAKKALSSIAYL